ncbi:glycosyltransferase family 2 protein [Phenylobacterium sp.]|uniref:glycosyltransferase family 2 protein n=1 Tax=Phenylobacterium sp. TaxID=1871053 RepID=UPI0025DB0128|nr:glycosyltransferase family 2 protein [Phenylobacterium sp.]
MIPHRLPQTSDGPADPPRIAVVMVNWNGWQDTLTGYESLAKSTYPAWELIVVENGSTDDSVTRLRGDRPRFHLVESPTNLGFAGACNVAVQAARERGADYVYFLNNDAAAEAGTLDTLAATSKSLDDAAVLGSVIRFSDDRSLQFWGSRQSKDGLPIWTPPSEERFAEAPALIESDFIMGASLFVPMPILDSVGPFDDRFFLNYEETDWCYRARAAGHRCLVVKDALVVHQGGATIGPPQGPMQIYFMRRNVLLLAEKHCTPRQYARLYVRQVLSIFSRLLRSMIGPGNDPRYSRTASWANAVATRDYMFRRFGDCPPIIRARAAKHRASI